MASSETIMDGFYPSPSSPPTALRLTTALLAAVLAANAPLVGAAQHNDAPIQNPPGWYAAEASLPSSQGYAAWYGTTAGTLPGVISDPWQELTALEDDWDGQGAKAVSPAAIDHAKRFLASISGTAASFTPFAYPDGSLGLESEEDHRSAHILVSPDNRFTYVIRIGDSVHRGDDAKPSSMRELLALLY